MLPSMLIPRKELLHSDSLVQVTKLGGAHLSTLHVFTLCPHLHDLSPCVVLRVLSLWSCHLRLPIEEEVVVIRGLLTLA